MPSGRGRLHSASADSRRLAAAVREEAMSDPDALCPVCGDRPPGDEWHADHIAACWPDSPLIAACPRCNTARPNRIPSAGFNFRLWQPTTIWSVPPEDARDFVLAAARRRYGDERHYLLVIARAPNWDGYYRASGPHVRLDAALTLLEQRTMAGEGTD